MRDRSGQVPVLTASLGRHKPRASATDRSFLQGSKRDQHHELSWKCKPFPPGSSGWCCPRWRTADPVPTVGNCRVRLGHHSSFDLLPPLDLVQWDRGSPHPEPGYPGLAGSQVVGSIMALRVPQPWLGDLRDICAMQSESCWELSRQAIPSHMPAGLPGLALMAHWPHTATWEGADRAQTEQVRASLGAGHGAGLRVPRDRNPGWVTLPSFLLHLGLSLVTS